MILNFKIKPMAKQSFLTTRSGAKYLDKSVMAYKKQIQEQAKLQTLSFPYMPFTKAVKVMVVYYFKRPDSLKKADRDFCDANGCINKSTKPDIDNLTKALFDALNGICWIDDALVARLDARKVWSGSDEIAVEIHEL